MLTGLVLREPELRLVLSAYADNVLLVVQDPGDLARVKACQAIYSAASSARVNWVKSSGLAVGDWRQQLMRERQQMASRPFASVDVALEVGAEQTDFLRGSLKGAPKPIAIEPCSGNKAAVLTVFLCLPRGSSGVPPPGQSGLAIASALIDISQQKPGDCKDKSSGIRNRKHHLSTRQGTCV
ncbi:unnamed protein product [Caretta caretta]